MDEPLVSITSAFYNEESVLLDMIKSVFAQTYANWELILVDDGSTDNSLKIAQSIDDPRVKVFTNGKNIGRSATLNKITKLANGKYIARFDADDMCSPRRIEREVEFLELHHDVDIVGTGSVNLDINDVPLGYSLPKTTHDEICRNPDKYIDITHPSCMGRKQWFEKNLYNESISISVDANLWVRTYKHSKFANIPEVLFYYRLGKAFTIKKQFNSRKTTARYLYKTHSQNNQQIRSCIAFSMQYVKFVIILLSFMLGCQKYIMAKRHRSLRAHLR